MKRILYICAGCKEVHYDNDYCEKDGDFPITIHRFNDNLKRMNEIKLQLDMEKQ